MGEYIRTGNNHRSFEPDDTDDVIHLACDVVRSLADIVATVKAKWPNAKFEDLEIEAKHIQTDGLGYPKYDLTDYTNFIVVTKKTTVSD